MVNILIPKLLIIFTATLTNLNIDSCIKSDLVFISQVNPIDIRKYYETSKFTFTEVSESKLIATGLIRLYQLFISSQDMQVCNFAQTCSRFGMETIQKYGIIWGVLMTSDRLQRCNGIGKKYYYQDIETGLSIDYPIEDYYIRRYGKKPKEQKQ